MLSRTDETNARACALEAADMGEFAVDMSDWGAQTTAATGTLMEDVDFGGSKPALTQTQAPSPAPEQVPVTKEEPAADARKPRPVPLYALSGDITGLPLRRAECESDPVAFGRAQLRKHVFDPADLGNAQRFYVTHGDRFKYIPEIEKWTRYTGGYWATCLAGEEDTAMLSVADAVRDSELPFYSPKDKDDEAEKALYNTMRGVHAQLCKHATQEAALKNASKLAALKLSLHALDRNSHLFNFKNGTLDTRTLQFKEHNRNDFISRQSPVNFNPDAPKPARWLKFLDECMLGDQELVRRLQKIWGLSLCRDAMAKEQYMFIHTGGGSNGKSTAFGTIARIFGAMQTASKAFDINGFDSTQAEPECGSYAGLLSPNTFIQDRRPDNGAGPTANLFDLQGTHINLISELPPGCAWNESLVKAITGKDAIVGRLPFAKRTTNFVVDGFMHFLTNNLPRIDSTNFSMIRRLQLIPWAAKFSGEKIDTDLPRKLMEEAEGIVQWLVEGLALYQADVAEGRDLRYQPDACKAELERFLESIDIIAQFRDACITTTTRDIDEVSSKDAFDLYLAWKKDANILASNVNKRTFTERLLKLGVEKRATRSNSGTVFVKIKLNHEYD